MKTRLFSTIVFAAAVMMPCAGLSQDHTTWTYNASVYEVNVRQYTQEGTFNAFRTHLGRLDSLDVSILWFMPIHPIGIKNRLGSLGSYYSVRDYYGVNPEFGTLQDFKALVDSIHTRGMFVLMDWVANHTSWDNVWTQTHPEFYVKDGQGNFIAPPGTNWSDVIQLDYGNSTMRDSMIAAMKYWVLIAHVDGFRCDAASKVPTDFWTKAAIALKQVKPDIFLLAEDQGVKYYASGFAMTYGWSYYGFGSGMLVKLSKGQTDANGFAAFVQAEEAQYPGSNDRLYFTSNHDENSWYGTDQELFGPATESFIALTHVFRSVPLMYGGQEAGLDHRLKFFDKDHIVWTANPRAELFRALLRLKRTNSALWNGTSGSPLVRITTTTDQATFAFVRNKGEDGILGVFNLSSTQATTTVTMSGYAGSYRDIFTDSTVSLDSNFTTVLPAWGYRVFERNHVSSGVRSGDAYPQSYSLSQNFPNPFNPSTVIRYGLPSKSHVTLAVFNTLGEQVATLVQGEQEAGYHEVRFDASGCSSGVYFCRLTAGNFVQTRKLLLLR
jgi:1,4-alpha-glucan branching enzyme